MQDRPNQPPRDQRTNQPTEPANERPNQPNTKVAKHFAEGPVSNLILRQAIPLTLAQVISLLYNIVDRIYIGHIGGGTDSTALTGVGLVFPIISVFLAVTGLFSYGASPLLSIAWGKGDRKKAEKIEGNTFVLLVVTSILVMAIFYIFHRPILHLFGASERTLPYAQEYMLIYLLGTVFFVVGTGMNSFISAQGFPKTAMMTTLLGAGLNIVLDPIFIFTLQLGVRGAALATVISQFFSFVWVLHFLRSDRAIFRLDRKDFGLDRALDLSIVQLGLAGFVREGSNAIVQVACNATLRVFGGDLYIGVMTIVNSVRDIAQLPINGLSSGSQPVLGFNYGAGKPERVKSGIKFTTIAGVTYGTVLWIIILLFPQLFLTMFTKDPALLAIGPRAIRLYFATFFVMIFQVCGQSTFVALGDSHYAVFFSIFRKIMIVLPLTLLLPHCFGLGTDGVFLAEPISNVLGGLACYLTMIRVVWNRQLNPRNVSVSSQK